MLYKFKSKAAGDVIMLEANGRKVLEIIGKEAGAQGIVQPAQMPAAIAALETAIADEQAAPRVADDESAADDGGEAGVTLGQRAVPFLEMLRLSHQAGADIVWGV